MAFHPDGSIPKLLSLQNSFAKQSLKSLTCGSIKIQYEDLEQGSAFTRITRPSFLPFKCYVKESIGRHCDLQAPMQWESPVSELDLSHLERKRGPDQAEGVREFRKPSKTQITVWGCKRSQLSWL